MKILVIIFLLIPMILNGQQVSQEWKRTYNGPGHFGEVCYKVLADNSGNIYTISGSFGIVTTKYDRNGNIIWEKTFNKTPASIEDPGFMNIDNSGNLIITGSSYINNNRIITIKYDTAGNVIWHKIFNESPNTQNTPDNQFVDKFGNIYITGSTFINNATDIITLKYDTNGNLIFSRTYNGSLNVWDKGYSVIADDSGNVYTAGYSNYNTVKSDFIVLKYGPGGNILWGRFYNGNNNNENMARSIVMDNDGNLLVSGEFNNGITTSDIATLKYNPGGDLLWERIYSGSSDSFDGMIQMKTDSLNYLYILATSRNNFFNNCSVIKYDENGNMIVNPVVSVEDYWFSNVFEFDNSGNIIVINTNRNSGRNNFAIADSTDPDTIGMIVRKRLTSSGNFLDSSVIYYPLVKDIFIRSIYLDDSANVYLAGNSTYTDEGTNADALTLKMNSDGSKSWDRIFLGQGTQSDYLNKMILDPSGDVFVTGTGTYGNNSSAVTMRYNSNGDLIWKSLYNRIPGLYDGSVTLKKDISGNIIVAGFTDQTFFNRDIAVIKYDSLGNELWGSRYGSTFLKNDITYQVETDSEDNIYVTGSSQGAGTDKDMITLKFNSSGDLIWENRYSGTANGDDISYDLAIDNEDNIYIAGSAIETNTGIDGCVIKYDSAGNQIWIKKFKGQTDRVDIFRKIEIDDLNNIYVCGETTSDTSFTDYLTVKYNSNGDQIWVKTYNGPLNNIDRINSMTIRNNFLYVTGESLGLTSFLDFLTLKYDPDGNQIWEARYNGSFNRSDRAAEIAIDNGNNVYVTGETSVGSTTDFVTVKYNSIGEQVWTLQYNGPGNYADRPNSIAVNNFGNVYVAGIETSLNSGFDFSLIKYSQTSGINDPGSSIFSNFKLYDNYPNPFNPSTRIKFDISVSSFVSLKIFDILGRELKSAINENLDIGTYEYIWNADNFPSGVYFYTINSGKFSETKKMTLIR